MGATSQLMRQRGARPRSGVALITVLLIMVVMGAIAAALFAVVGSQGRADSNRVEMRKAELLAQAGVNHALALIENVLSGASPSGLLVGANGVAGGNDDGQLTGYTGLTADTRIDSTGRTIVGMGKYYVRVIDDEQNATAEVLSGARIGGSIWADGGTYNGSSYATTPTESDNRVTLQCLGVTDAGSRYVVNVRLQREPAPGLTIGGDLNVFAQVKVQGTCGTVHANGTILDTRGSANWGGSANYPVATNWSSTTGTIPTYFVGAKSEAQPARGIPVVPAIETLCTTPSAVTYLAMANADRTQAINLDNITDGTTICVYGNVSATCSTKCRNAGSNRFRPLSIIATGSIRLSINNVAAFVPAHPDGWQFVAGGDLDITETGNNSITLGNQGAVFCKSQMRLDTDFTADGQVICGGSPNPAKGAPGPGQTPVLFSVSGKYQGDFVTTSNVAKTSVITFNCGGTMANIMQIPAIYPSNGN